MDLRVQRTVKSIEHAFVSLTLEQGFESVTVRQISKQAEINPKTFYDHYHDKYDLVHQLEARFLDRYQQLLKKRFVYHQAIKEDTLPTGLEKLVTNMTSDPEFCQTVIALESIQDETVRFKSQVVVLIKDALVDADISQDPYIIDILATIALKTIDYYMRTDTPFSIQREMDLLRVLNRLL